MTKRASFHISSRAISIAAIAGALALTGCLGAHHRRDSEWKRAHHGESYRKHRGVCIYEDAIYSRGALKCIEKRMLECGENGHWAVLQEESCG